MAEAAGKYRVLLPVFPLFAAPTAAPIAAQRLDLLVFTTALLFARARVLLPSTHGLRLLLSRLRWPFCLAGILVFDYTTIVFARRRRRLEQTVEFRGIRVLLFLPFAFRIAGFKHRLPVSVCNVRVVFRRGTGLPGSQTLAWRHLA